MVFLLFYVSFSIVCYIIVVWLIIVLVIFRFLFIWFLIYGNDWCFLFRVKCVIFCVYIFIIIFIIFNYVINSYYYEIYNGMDFYKFVKLELLKDMWFDDVN